MSLIPAPPSVYKKNIHFFLKLCALPYKPCPHSLSDEKLHFRL